MAVVKLGFKVFPPLLGRGAGRPKVQRYRGCLEKNASKKVVKRKRCGDFGHFEKTCKLAEIGEDGERTPPRNKACFYPFIWLVSILYMNHVVCHPSIEELWGHAAKILTNNMLILQNDILLSLITCNPSIATIDNHISFIHDIATVTYEYNRIA